MSNLDPSDWFAMLFTAAMYVAGTSYIFLHASDANFLIWAGLLTASGGLFHGLNIYYDKSKGAGP